MQAAATAVQAQAVAATTGASAGSAGKAAAASGVRRYPNARAAYGIIARRAPSRSSPRPRAAARALAAWGTAFGCRVGGAPKRTPLGSADVLLAVHRP
jgi:cell division septation protein DedD